MLGWREVRSDRCCHGVELHIGADVVKSDLQAKTVRIDPETSLVRVDGIILFKRVLKESGIFLQFKDSDRLRSRRRGTEFVEIPLSAFVDTLK
jgi:hypothetical protein